MKQTITFDRYVEAFKNLDRYDSYTYEGHKALFEYLEELEDSCGVEIELDPIAICCDYTQYNNFEEIQEAYSAIQDLEDLYAATDVINCSDGSIIIADF